MSVIEKHEELEAYFQTAGKPRDRWRVGTEYEKVGIDRNTGQAGDITEFQRGMLPTIGGFKDHALSSNVPVSIGESIQHCARSIA